MDEQPGGQDLELVLQPSTDRYDTDDDRWLRQVSEFFVDLEKEVGGVRRLVTPVTGTKGGVSEIILALGSAGAFAVSLDYFRAWLARDKSRKLDITWTMGGQKETISVQGDGIDQSTLKTLADAAAKRLGEARWPTPATGLS